MGTRGASEKEQAREREENREENATEVAGRGRGVREVTKVEEEA